MACFRAKIFYLILRYLSLLFIFNTILTLTFLKCKLYQNETPSLEPQCPVSIQTAFFRKHGFRVENRKYYPRYVTMVRPEEDSNSNLLTLS